MLMKKNFLLYKMKKEDQTVNDYSEPIKKRKKKKRKKRVKSDALRDLFEWFCLIKK